MNGLGRVFDRPRGSGRNWAIAYFVRGQEQRESVARALGTAPATVTRDQAERLLRQRLDRAATGRLLSAHSERLTVGEVLAGYEQTLRLEGRKSVGTIACHLKPIRKALGTLRAAHLTTAELRTWMERQLGHGYAPGTVNYRMGLLRAACRQALAEDRLARVPHFPALTVHNARQGFFEKEEFAALLAHLPSPIGEIARFGYLTGWRASEITGLRWADIDRSQRMVRLPDSKNGHGRVLPLVGELWELVERRWKARPVGARLAEWVFHRHAKPIADFRWVWNRACVDAGLTGKLFHDFRRTAVRNMVAAGVPESAAMQVTGHRSRALFERYNITTAKEAERALEQRLAFEARG